MAFSIIIFIFVFLITKIFINYNYLGAFFIGLGSAFLSMSLITLGFPSMENFEPPSFITFLLLIFSGVFYFCGFRESE